MLLNFVNFYSFLSRNRIGRANRTLDSVHHSEILVPSCLWYVTLYTMNDMNCTLPLSAYLLIHSLILFPPVYLIVPTLQEQKQANASNKEVAFDDMTEFS
jgi:hypothetical protein